MKTKGSWPVLLAAAVGLTMAGCSGGGGDDGPDKELRQKIQARGLKGDPAEGRVIGNITDPLPALGKHLFFTKAVSANLDTACVTCHHPFFGGGDNLAIPVGVDAVDPALFGPGRIRANKGPTQSPPFGIGDPPMPRNSPTVFGLAFWDKSITWDGTVFSERGTPGTSGADSRIIAPLDTPPVTGMLTNPNINTANAIPYEQKFDSAMSVSAGHGLFPGSVRPAMRDGGFSTLTTDLAVRQRIAARIGNYGAGAGELPTNNWLPLFRAAFNDNTSTPEQLVTANNISKAIAAYERTQTFTETPWKKYVKGDDNAITPAQKRGALLFYRTIAEGGGNCASCHSGDFFTDEEYWVLAVPQIGRGKADANSATDTNDDWGRGHVTLADADKWAYRTPTLLNVEVTGPYGHTGVFPTLEGIIRHHLNAEASVNAFNFNTVSTAAGPINMTNAQAHTQLALTRLKAQRAANLPRVLRDANLTDANVADLVEFMKALTDPCTKDRTCLAKWVPTAADPNPDGLRICPKDNTGALLSPGTCQ
ncbi:MAG TPA: cytochrome c peroxidase [Usitatibacteraceae bacterium]|nr:cytochrome c peroxidase [Usitatibacteraceae bacterium]